MRGETNLDIILKTLQPKRIPGDFVFCTVDHPQQISQDDIVMLFRESEAYTVILRKELADKLRLPYNVVLAWIELSVHSSLEAVGLTAVFSKALSEQNISCNVVAAYYHDHIFVKSEDAHRAMTILNLLSK